MLIGPPVSRQSRNTPAVFAIEHKSNGFADNIFEIERRLIAEGDSTNVTYYKPLLL